MGVPGGNRRDEQFDVGPPDRGESTTASRIASYVIVVGGAALLGFAMSLCSIGNSGRYVKAQQASDLDHLLIIVGSTLAGGVVGWLSVRKILKGR